MNARFGLFVREVVKLMDLPDSCSYPVVPDPVQYPNDNAYVLSTICVDCKMLVINNLEMYEQHFLGNKTFRKGREWISELDIALVNESMVKHVVDFHVLGDDSLPSDHAPVSLTLALPCIDLEDLECRAEHLGGHAALQDLASASGTDAKPINMSNVDNKLFLRNVLENELPNVNLTIDTSVKQVTDVLYSCIKNARSNVGWSNGNINNDDIDSENRWDRMLKDKDDERIWKAVNWKGDYCEFQNKTVDKPTDEEFKHFFENISDGHPNVEFDDIGIVYIPMLDDPITEYEISRESKCMNSNKACGLDGISPGIFKLLPGSWLLLLTGLFQSI